MQLRCVALALFASLAVCSVKDDHSNRENFTRKFYIKDNVFVKDGGTLQIMSGR
jgi:hypothetical protein